MDRQATRACGGRGPQSTGMIRSSKPASCAHGRGASSRRGCWSWRRVAASRCRASASGISAGVGDRVLERAHLPELAAPAGAGLGARLRARSRVDASETHGSLAEILKLVAGACPGYEAARRCTCGNSAANTRDARAMGRSTLGGSVTRAVSTSYRRTRPRSQSISSGSSRHFLGFQERFWPDSCSSRNVRLPIVCVALATLSCSFR